MLNQPQHNDELAPQSNGASADTVISGPNPFPGLRPFSSDESYFYFGRDGQIDEILLKIAQNRFVTVMGYSGSGKSSLMFCGFIPVLHGGFMAASGPHWNVVTTRPGEKPIRTLANSVVDLLIRRGAAQKEERAVHLAVISSILRSSVNGLVEVARYLQTDYQENIFFLIDQFEELFRYHDDDAHKESANEAQHYVKLILTAIRQRESPVYVALTMRSDFIGECSKFPGLTSEINKSNYLVPQMSREEKRSAIEGPIAVAGGKIAPRLVKRLLNDIGNNQDQLPILQHALMRTWDHWIVTREPGEPMDLRHYQAIGQITQALSLHANELYDELTSREKEIAEILFKSITEKNSDNRGLRRPCRLGLIAELAEASEEEVIKVVDHFRQPGRSFLMPAAHIPLTADSMIELSHESLMRIWNRLSAWVEDEFESASMYKRLSDAAAMYQIGKTGLWRPPDLQLALNWQKKQRPTREWAQRYDEAFERAIVFLDTSRITYEAELKNQEMMQKRVLRRTRATAVFLGIAFLVAILFFVLAYIQKIEADRDRIAAVESQREADKQREEATRQKNLAEESKAETEKKAEELEIAFKTITETLEQVESQRKRAEAAAFLAHVQEEKARLAGQQEMMMKEEADFNAQVAERNLQLANSLYYRTKAQELASKAAVQDDDYQLSGLQAMQGYRFHTRYDGKKYDRYIYEGLYSAMAKLLGSSYNALKIDGPPRVHMRSLALSSDNKYFYVSGADGRIYKGDLERMKSQKTGFETAYPSKVIALSRDERYLVNGSDSTAIHIYDLQKGGKPKVLSRLKAGTNDIKFLPDNSGFYFAGQDKTINHYDIASDKVRTLLQLDTEVKALSLRSDGKVIAAASWSGKILLINLDNLNVQELFNEPNMRMLSVKFSSSGKYLAFGTEEGSRRGLVRLHDFETGKTRQFTGHRAGVYDLEFSFDEKLLASAGSDKRLQLYVIDSLDDLPVVMENNNGFIWDIEFSKNSDFLIAACSESEIRVWPTDPALLANEICPKLTRNMTNDEWLKYVGEDTKYEKTCDIPDRP